MEQKTVMPENFQSKPLNILVVDDSWAQLQLISTQLKQWDFNIVQCISANEALEKCKNAHFDIILSDWVMPEISGIEFCRKFRALDHKKYTYFILLTSKSEKADIAEGLENGADDFLSKPLNKVELRARIKAGQRILAMEDQLQIEIKRSNKAYNELHNIHEEMDKDLRQAEKLQRSLLPAPHITHDKYSISNIFKSSGRIGGDMVGTFSLNENRIAIYSFDVSGHGISSALMTMQIHSLLSPHNKENNIAFINTTQDDYKIRTPDEIAQALNKLVTIQMDTDLYFTLVYADINLDTGYTELVQCGHPHPLIFNPENGIKTLGAGGLPIGMFKTAAFETVSFTLTPTDKLLLFSDGLIECENTKGDFLENEGLSKILTQHKSSNGLDLLNNLVSEVTHYTQTDKFYDDLSVIMFEFKND